MKFITLEEYKALVLGLIFLELNKERKEKK